MTQTQQQPRPSIANGREVFAGCVPALMTPCRHDGTIDHDALAKTATDLMAAGMSGVVYCGSMGDWPLLSDRDRQQGVATLVEAGIPVIVGTGAVNTETACQHARHAQEIGAAGLMIIPRLLSRGTSPAAQADHFARVLSAADSLPSVIYNSPYYGYQTKADLYFRLREQYTNLIGFKEFGGADSLRYAAEHITSGPNGGMLLVGVDTQVYFGFVHCGAVGSITGIGNCLPREVLRLTELSRRAAAGDAISRRRAMELDEAMKVLCSFDEGPDLTLYYRLIATLTGNKAYARPMDPNDTLSDSQRVYAQRQLHLFQSWYAQWEGASDE